MNNPVVPMVKKAIRHFLLYGIKVKVTSFGSYPFVPKAVFIGRG